MHVTVKINKLFKIEMGQWLLAHPVYSLFQIKGI